MWNLKAEDLVSFEALNYDSRMFRERRSHRRR